MRDEDFPALGLMPPPHRNPIPGPVQCAADILQPQLARDPDAPALIGRHARFCYAELDRAANAAAGLLREHGIGAGDRVAMTLANHPDIIIAFLATQRIGAIWLGINTTLTAAERVHVLKDAEARLLIAEPDVLAQVRAALPIGGIAVTPGAPGDWSQGLARHSAPGRCRDRSLRACGNRLYQRDDRQPQGRSPQPTQLLFWKSPRSIDRAGSPSRIWRIFDDHARVPSQAQTGNHQGGVSRML